MSSSQQKQNNNMQITGEMWPINKEKWVSKTGPKIIEMMELAGQDFKTAIVNMFKCKVKTSNLTDRKMQTLRKNQKE